MKSRICVVLMVCMALPPFMFADFQYQETTKITGGSIVQAMKLAGIFSKQARQVGQPITSTVLVKGNRMARISPDYTEIIDLDKETITNIDHTKHQYTVMTFEQMKQQMQQAAEEARKKQAEHPEQSASQTPPPEMNFTVNVRNTGAAKQLSGLNANESILTMALEAKDKQSGQQGAFNITNDMWLAPDVPGYNEVRDFNKRFALKMGMIFNQAVGPSLAATQPGMAKGMGEMAKEMSKIQGTPVLQITRMGSTPDGKPLPAASEAPLPPTPDMPNAGEMGKDAAKEGAQEGAATAISKKIGLGGLGGFGGFGRKKKKEEPPKETPAEQKAQQNTAAVLMETTAEMTGFSSGAVDEARFQVPAGYKQIQPQMRQGQ